MDIPTELYEDDAVCYIASRYHVSTQEAVRGFLVQIGIVHGEISDFHLEDNEIDIMNGLMDAYSSRKYPCRYERCLGNADDMITMMI